LANTHYTFEMDFRNEQVAKWFQWRIYS